MTNALDAKRLAEIDAALAGQRMFEAVRIYREATQASLASALAFVQAREVGPSAIAAARPAAAETLPDEVQRYLDSGHARAGDLLGWWRNPRGDFCVLVRYASAPQVKFELGVFPPVVGHWGHDLNGLTCGLSDLQKALAGSGFAGAEWGIANPLVATLQAVFDPLQAKPAAPKSERARPSRSALFLLDGERFERDWLYLPSQLDRQWLGSRLRRTAADSEVAELASDLAIDLSQPASAAFDGTPAMGPLLWTLCHRECASNWVTAESSDSLFADIEARPPAWRELSPAAQPAWNTLLAMVDCSARRLSFLPWWLQAAASHSGASVGLLSTVDCRLLHRFANELNALFSAQSAQADIAARLRLCGLAAAGNHWLLGWEAAG